MEKFAEFLWYLLTAPLKRVEKQKNAWWILFKTIGALLDQNKTAFFAAREESMVATCSYALLPIQADDRRLNRYEGEDWEDFRTRIATYPEVCRLGGTNPGVMLAVAGLGYRNFTIQTAIQLFGDLERWAEFYLVISMDLQDELIISTSILRQVVRNTKETGALDNYMYSLNSSATHDIWVGSSLVIDSFCYPFLIHPPLLLDGSWALDGSFRLSGEKGEISESPHMSDMSMDISTVLEIRAKSEITATVEDELWYLDGSESLDGSRTLSAEIYEWDF